MTITGPVEGGVHGWPFGAPAFDVADAGCVLEEHLLEGTATGYEVAPGTTLADDGRWSVRPAREAPFRTRLLVARPVDPARFNGTVVVNWQNVTVGVELGSPGRELLDEGFAWVGASVQQVGIDGFEHTRHVALRNWDPERYGTLEHPGDDFSFDIYTQIARAVGPRRGTSLPDPMGGLPVQRLLGSGASQSALRLRGYANAVQPIEHAFDGFLSLVDIGVGSLPDTRHLDPSTLTPTSRPGRPTRVRDDLDVPVMVLNSESEAVWLFPRRQPDTDRLRLWEVTGTAHGGGPEAARAIEHVYTRDGIDGLFTSASRAGQLPDGNVLAYAPVQRAAMRHLQEWMVAGTPPPSQPRLEIDPGPPAALVRDEWGNALGGIRVPDLAVPIAAHHGLREGDPHASLAGRSTPFSEAQLRERYPSRQAFLDAYAGAIDDAVAAGVLLPDDTDTLRTRAWHVADAFITW